MTTANNNYTFSMDEGAGVRIVILGVGGMGNNAMEILATTAISGLDLFSLNTDIQPLRRCRGSKPVQIGGMRTNGKGAGGDSDIGRLSAEDDAEKIRNIVCDAELVFITSGMGGGTGTGATPVIARICRELNILSVCVVTMPMDCEGPKRTQKARAGLAELRKHVDSLLIIENEKLSTVMHNDDISIIEVFRCADKVIVDSVNAVSEIINSHGYINLDLADLKKVLQRDAVVDCVDAYIGVGGASGPNRGINAAEMALSNQLLREVGIYGATNLLINVTGSDQMGHKEAMAAISSIVEKAGDLDREIFMGIATDNSMGDKLSITVIATGLTAQNSAVASAQESVKHGSRTQSACLESTNTNNTIIPSPSLPDISSNPISGPANSVTSDNDREATKKVLDEFGSSPLIRKEEWQTPAYLRSKSKANATPKPSLGNSFEKTHIADIVSENKYSPHDQETRYHQAVYTMAH